MRVRKVVTRSGKRFRGKFPSQKLNRMVHWESMIERDAILHFEYHPLVLDYQEQPSIEIYYDRAGDQHQYFPDFRLTFIGSEDLFVEVKPVHVLATKVVRDKLQAISKRFNEQARLFRVMTEDDIRRQPLFGNLQKLHLASKRASQKMPNEELLRALSGGPRWKLANISSQLHGVQNVLRLVQANYLQIDLEKQITDNSDVWASGSEGGTNGSFRI